MNSLVSVIIPTYNREKLVGRAIQSVLAQTYSSLEIIVVDDCSSDRTLEAVKKFDDARLRLVQHSKNMGVSAACNTGIREANGDFVFILNDDDFLLASALENLIKQFQKSAVQNLGAVYGWSLWINERRKPIKITHSTGRGDLFDPILKGHVFTNLLLKREVFTKIGVYNEELKSNEDLEFYLRLGKCYQFDFIPEIVAVISSHPHSHLSAFSKEHMGTYVRIQNKYGLRSSLSKGFARSVFPSWLYRFLAQLKAKMAVELFLLKNPHLKTILKKIKHENHWLD